MKIARVALTNWGPYEDAEIIFDQPLSVVRADNATGKSKLTQAIQLSFTRVSEGTEANGSGATDKIRLGADKGIITTTVETPKCPVQLITQYTNSGGRTQKIIAGSGTPETENLAKGFKRFLDDSQERLSCVLDGNYFVNAKPADQKAILAALVLPKQHTFDPEMVALVDKYFYTIDGSNKTIAEADRPHIPTTDWTKPPVAVIDSIYGDDRSGLYNLRKLAKSTLSGIYLPPTPAKPEFTAEAINTKLAELRAKQTKEAKKVKAGGTVQIGRIEQSLEQEREKLTRAHTDRKSLQESKALVEAKQLSESEINNLKGIAARFPEYKKLTIEIGDLNAEAQAQKRIQETFEGLLTDEDGNALDSADCPTCSQAITREFVAEKIRTHRDLQKHVEAEIQEVERRRAGLGDISAAQTELDAQALRTTDILDKTRKIVANEEEIGRIETEVRRLTCELTGAQAAEGKKPDTSALDSLNAEIGQWEARLGPAAQYDATLGQISEAQARQKAQQEKVAELERLCVYFGPKGIKADLIGENIGAFEESVNKVLAAWGYQAKLSIEPYEFMVATPKIAGYLPLKELSGFERLAFGVALQCAIAVHSKLRMIVVDRGDTMIGAQRNRLLGCVKKMIDEKMLDQAVVLMSDSSREVPKKDGVAFYFIENGKIERL